MTETPENFVPADDPNFDPPPNEPVWMDAGGGTDKYAPVIPDDDAD